MKTIQVQISRNTLEKMVKQCPKFPEIRIETMCIDGNFNETFCTIHYKSVERLFLFALNAKAVDEILRQRIYPN